jgi:hypothetical protein
MTWILFLLVMVVALSAAGTLATWHAVLLLREALALQPPRDVVVVQVGQDRGRPPEAGSARDTERPETGSGRERLRQRLQARMGEAHRHSGREDGAQGADGPRTEMTHG